MAVEKSLTILNLDDDSLSYVEPFGTIYATMSTSGRGILVTNDDANAMAPVKSHLTFSA